MLDPSKRRQRAVVVRSLEEFRCIHGEPVVVRWHPRPDGPWFDIQAHCSQGREAATEIAAAALAAFSSSG